MLNISCFSNASHLELGDASKPINNPSKRNLSTQIEKPKYPLHKEIEPLSKRPVRTQANSKATSTIPLRQKNESTSSIQAKTKNPNKKTSQIKETSSEKNSLRQKMFEKLSQRTSDKLKI